MALRRCTTSNQCWNYAVYINVEIYNVEKRHINVAYFKVDLNNVDNVETMLSFSTSIFTTLGNVETTLWTYPFEKKTVPPNISTSDQSCFILVVQYRNNIDPTLKMKQIPTSDFQRCNVGSTLFQRWYNFMSMLFQRGLNVRKSYIKTNRASISTVCK